MRAPDFWAGDGLAAVLLAPLGQAAAAAGALRRALARPERLPVPVVCVGNLVAGGAGKTPLALMLAERLAAAGRVPHFLTRGYGGRLAGPVRVDPGRHTAAAVGDEPLLLAAVAPTWVSRDRPAGGRAAVAAGAAAIIMDDGHQNPSLAKDLSVLVVDGGAGFGNGRLVPAGPLREPVAAGLARADAVVVVGADRTGVAGQLGGFLPVLAARLVPDPAVAESLRGRAVLAFAGIGRPAKLFETLAEMGALVVARHPFPDHHAFGDGEIEALLAQAERAGAVAVTTAKDAIRLPPGLRARVTVLPVRLEIDPPDGLAALLARLW